MQRQLVEATTIVAQKSCQFFYAYVIPRKYTTTDGFLDSQENQLRGVRLGENPCGSLAIRGAGLGLERVRCAVTPTVQISVRSADKRKAFAKGMTSNYRKGSYKKNLASPLIAVLTNVSLSTAFFGTGLQKANGLEHASAEVR